MNLRSIIWAAVSTKEQAQNDKESIPAQIEQARQVIEERGWQEVAEPLVVPGQSRSINWLDQAMREIPQMAQLVEMAEAGKIDLVVVRDWDRLARTESLRVQISTRLREQGVQVYSLNQPVEPSEHPGKVTDTALIVEGMTGILSEIENRLRVRRRNMGMLARVKKGFWGGQTAPYGYRYTAGQNILEVVDEEAEVVRRIYQLAYEGKSNRMIAKELNLLGIPRPGGKPPWVNSTVSRILRRPTYAGHVPYSGKLFEGKHEPIVDRELWLEVQRRTDKRKKFKGRAVGSQALLVGLLRCGHCHYTMSVRKKKSGIYYSCGMHSDSGGAFCQSNHQAEDQLMSELLRVLSSYVDDPSLLEAAMAAQDAQTREEVQRRRQRALEELSQIDDRRERQFIAYEKGEISLEEYAIHRQRLQLEEEDLRQIVAEAEDHLKRRKSLENVRAIIDQVVRSWDRLDRKGLKQQLMALFEVVYAFDDRKVEVIFSK